MGTFTIKGSDTLDARIEHDLERIKELVSPHCEAGILLGGYGRGEGTPFIAEDGTQHPFNDYDLVVITDTVNTAVRLHFSALEKQLTQDVGLPVDLCPYARHKLPSREFSLLNYEMKYGHLVLWGDECILDAMPDYDHAAIPKTEGSRLLLNRGKLLLDIQIRLSQQQPLSDDEAIRFIKFIQKVWLAIGDTTLLAADDYDLSYTTKKKRILNLPDIPDRQVIISRFSRAVELKEWGNYAALETFNMETEFEQVRTCFIQYFECYLSRFALRECSIPKAIALNLKWNHTFDAQHPRKKLYRLLLDLLKGEQDSAVQRFYELQRRFS